MRCQKISLLAQFLAQFFFTLDKTSSPEYVCGKQKKNAQTRQTPEQFKFMLMIIQTITALNRFGMIFFTAGFKEFTKEFKLLANKYA